MIFFNFRPDRAIQIFNRLHKRRLSILLMRGKTSETFILCTYDGILRYCEREIAFHPEELGNTLGEVFPNMACGSSYRRNGEIPARDVLYEWWTGEEFPGETRILINSPKVATYDLKPEMSAYEVTEALLKEIENDTQDAIILNFANPDMVGHSGMLEPTIKAVEAVDECLGKVVDAILAKGGTAIITADHGNSDEVVTLMEKR